MYVKKVTKPVRKLTYQFFVWMLITIMILDLLPIQQAIAADLPMQQEVETIQDVKSTDWFYDAVEYAQKNGILSGTGDNSFSPQGTMTRAMFVTALGRMAGVDVSKYSTTDFSDVIPNSWYSSYVAWAVEKGITYGTSDGKYSPDVTVTREQMATMTLRYFESYQIPYQTGSLVTTKPRDFASISPWAADSIIKLWQAGLFNGDNKGNFNPKTQAIRAEAAAFFMRSDKVVKAWEKQNQETETPTPKPDGNTGGNNENKSTYTITFDSNGGKSIAAKKVQQGEVIRDLPSPAKDGYIFQGWFTDSDFTQIFVDGSTVTADTKLYAKYIDNVSNAVQNNPNHTELNVAPNFTIAITDKTATLTAQEVEKGITFKDVSNPISTGIKVSGANGQFIVSSAGEDGMFKEGNTYQLTLTNDNLSFTGNDKTTRVYAFSVAKQEVMNIPLNPDLIYIPYTEVKDMQLNGKVMESPTIPVVTTTVGNSESNELQKKSGSGAFKYNGDISIRIGDAIAIYQGVRPDKRTVKTTGEDDGDVAYIEITSIENNNYTYKYADTNQVLFKPDVLPVNNNADTDNDPTNNSITIEHSVMNYSEEKYEKVGLSELTTVDVGDFIAFYEGEFAEKNSSVISYGRITSIISNAEMDVITYVDVTLEDIKNSFNLYQQQPIDGTELLTENEIVDLENEIEQQAIESGFLEKSVDYLSNLAMETPEFKQQANKALLKNRQVASLNMEGFGFKTLAQANRVEVENKTVVAKLGSKLNNINGKNSGVSASLEVSADIVITINEESKLVIHMTGTFTEEISLDLGINGEMLGHWLTFWDVPYWYNIDDYIITTNLDAYTYTGINITAEIATVSVDKLEEALNDWMDAKTSGTLGQVMDIASQIKAQMEEDEDADLDIKALKVRYQEMLENETDWVSLIEINLFEKSVRVAYGIVEVKFESQFVVNAKVNLTVGTDFNYKTAKRYVASLYVLSVKGSSDTISLPGDGDYQFTFYVMGTIGLRAGVHMEIKAGLISVDLNSVGLSVEPGAYVDLWGYFYYQLKNTEGIQKTQSLGALFVEMGIYLEVEVVAQLGDGLLEGSIPVYDNTWPLYTVGMAMNVEDFAYPQDDNLGLIFRGGLTSQELPESFLKMDSFDLKTGDTVQNVYSPLNFDIQVVGDNFVYMPGENIIKVKDYRLRSSNGYLVITWKGAPLAFTLDPIKRTIPLNWIRSADGEITINLNPLNGDPIEVVTAKFNDVINIKNKVPAKPGYAFQGWYTSLNNGTKVEIPNRMPTGISDLFAKWSFATDTPYKVNHYLIDPNGKSSTLDETEILTGTTNANIHIVSDKYKNQGYMDGEAKGYTIKADGSTVVNIYYKPISRTATFNLGYEGAKETQVTDLIYKNIVNQIPIPNRPGYKFEGWSPETPTTMPTENTTYTAKWTIRNDVPYKVVYLKQNIGKDSFTVADAETYYGTTNTEAVMPEELLPSYEGFTLDLDSKGTSLKANIEGNGTTVLRVYYKRNAYKMTINYNDQKTAKKTIEMPYGATTTLHLGEPIWQGHVFKGWSPEPSTTMPMKDVEYVAQWDTNQYTISFNNNGGIEEVPNQVVDYGLMVTEPTMPTKSGYIFGGWYTDSNLTNMYTFSTPVTKDLTLYAKWMRSYTMSFDSNEGSEVLDQTFGEGTKATAPPMPMKEGYVFGGWYSDEELTTMYDFSKEIVKGNIKLYAKWAVGQKTFYNVLIAAEGNLESKAETLFSGDVEAGTILTPPEPPIRKGYTFQNYAEKYKSEPYDFTQPVTRDVIILGRYASIKYTLSFESNGGSEVKSQQVAYYLFADDYKTTPSREGYVFGGWYSDTNLTNKFDFKKDRVLQDTTLYAKWIPLFDVSFNSNGGSNVTSQIVQFDNKAVAPSAPTRAGYVFEGWYSDESLTNAYNFETQVTTDLTLYVKWIEQFTVNFESNNGSAIEKQIVTDGDVVPTPVAPTRNNYVFEGWYSDESLTNPYNFAAPVLSNTTVYAKWRAVHTVTFVESSVPTQYIKKIVLDGDTVSPPDDPSFEKEGQLFYGWITRDYLGNWKYFDFDKPITGNITIDDKWGNKCTVTFESNGGSAVEPQVIKLTDKIKVPEPPVREGYIFEGWYVQAALLGAWDFENRLPSSDRTLYAKWTAVD